MQYQLLHILWKQNSPYGTYVATDYVDVYWDTDTEALVVKKNGGVITSGNSIPPTFKYNSKLETYYKTEDTFPTHICLDTSKLVWNRISAFPYLLTTELFDHPSCSLTPTSCDLVFDSLPIVTNASAQYVADGAITVVATSSNSVKYNLNKDFEYNTGGQSSGTFSSLRSGNYIIYARDSINCLNRISVTVGVDYTYGVKYRLEYYNIDSYLHHKTEILEKNYSGDVYEVKGGDNPTILEVSSKGDSIEKFQPILNTVCTLNLISETNDQYESLYTNDPEKYRLKHSVDYGSGYETLWIGKVLTNQYNEAYRAAPTEIEVVANDALSNLENVLFLDESGNRIFGKIKQIELLAYLLRRTNLDLQIRCGVNIYADTMDATAADDPLDQAYIDCDRYYLNDNTPTFRDIVEFLLTPYGAQLVLFENYWNIVRIEEKLNSFDYRTFDTSGNYVSNGTYSASKEISRTGNFVFQNGFNKRINPGAGKLQLIYDLGLRINLLKNGSFRPLKTVANFLVPIITDTSAPIDFTQPDLTYWTLVTSSARDPSLAFFANLIEVRQENSIQSDLFCSFRCSSFGSYLLSDTFSLSMAPNDSIRFTIKFRTTGFQFPRKIKFEITYGDYFLNGDGTWNTNETRFVYIIKEPGRDEEVSVIAKSPETEFTDNINVKVFMPSGDDYDFTTFTQLKAAPTDGLNGITGAAEGDKKSVYYFTGDDQIFHYVLTRTTDAEDVSVDRTIVRPDDYNATTSPYQWVLDYEEYINSANPDYDTLIKNISLDFLTSGNIPPPEAHLQTDLENDNPNPKTLYIRHGSFFEEVPAVLTFGVTSLSVNPILQIESNPIWGSGGTITGENLLSYNWDFYIPKRVTSADVCYTAYLRDSSGNGYVNWTRDGHSELSTLENIILSMYGSQYNRPYKSLRGTMYSLDTLISPLFSFQNNFDSGEKYVSNFMIINFRKNSTEIELLEFNPTADADIDLDNPTNSAGFTTGFSLGFNA